MPPLPTALDPVAITLVANAEGESPMIAPSRWVEVKGSKLAPAGALSHLAKLRP